MGELRLFEVKYFAQSHYTHKLQSWALNKCRGRALECYAQVCIVSHAARLQNVANSDGWDSLCLKRGHGP